MHDVLILADPEAVAEAATEFLVAEAQAAIEAHGRFVLALSSAAALEPLYRRLAEPGERARIPWDRTWIVFGDETAVGAPDAAAIDRGAREARERLLEALEIDVERVLRIDADNPQASRAAHFHEERLRELFPDTPHPGIDAALLGVEPDGRTATLLPGSDALDVADRWVTASYEPEHGTWNVALTLSAWNAARQALFVVTGRERAERAAEAFGDPCAPPTLPAQRIVPEDGTRVVLVDEEAAAGLGETV